MQKYYPNSFSKISNIHLNYQIGRDESKSLLKLPDTANGDPNI